jgi:hypothetical protein
MKSISTTVAMLLFLASPASVLAEEQAVPAEAAAVKDVASDAVVTETETGIETVTETAIKPAAPADPATPHPMNEMEGMHMGKMGGMHMGKGQQGKGGHGYKKHGGGQHGKGKHEKHEQVVQRLDMIEARLAKIESMLESLVRR